MAPAPPAPVPTAPESFTPEPFGIPGFDAPSFDAPSFDAPSEVSGMAEAAAAASVQPSPADLSLDVPMEEEPPELLPEIEGFELGSSENLDVSMTGGSASAFISGELSDFSQQGGLAPADGLDFDGGAGAEQPIELASPHEFLDSSAPDPFAATAPLSVPRVAPAPAPAPARVPMPAAPPAAAAPAQADGEAALRVALSQASREVIERVVWEVVPQLAEIILREHIERMERERQ
jgi:hypothetical protein